MSMRVRSTIKLSFALNFFKNCDDGLGSSYFATVVWYHSYNQSLDPTNATV